MAKPDLCAFCGASGTDFKPEHWVSKWISRATIGKNQGIVHNTPGREPWLGRMVDLTVPLVCPECNWRSQAGEQATVEVGPVPSYRTTLTIGHLVMDVIGLLHPLVSVTTEPDERFVQVWPVRSETIDWPPPCSFRGIVDNDLS